MKAHTLLLLLALPIAQAADEAPAAKSSASAAKNRGQVCFAERVTGSHIKKRICMTEAEYEARRKADQEAMMKLTRGPSAEKQRSTGNLR